MSVKVILWYNYILLWCGALEHHRSGEFRNKYEQQQKQKQQQ